jgi:isopenicillin-N N-acyltransferase-like protein
MHRSFLERRKVTEDKQEGPQRRESFWRRVLVALVVGSSILVLLGFLVLQGMKWYGLAREPVLAETPAVISLPVTKSDDGRRLIGDCWIVRKDGILRMSLTGDAFTLGYCSAVLTQGFIEEQEKDLLRVVRQFVPSRIKLFLLKLFVLLRNRDLPSYVSREHQIEIYGVSRGYKDPFPEIGPLYHRLLNYHAAHDISHALMDNPLVGCTSFAAWGNHTLNGHLLLGRNFDFDAGRSFDTNKIVIRVQPEKGIGYISVAWPGMIGVVSGINDERIAVTVNAARSSDVRRIGTPVSLMVREIMQHASTLSEAVAIIEKSEVFVADSYLLADGKSGEAIVVEKTPARCSTLRTNGEYIVCSNHFRTDLLKDDEANKKYMTEGTTIDRLNRMETLVRSSAGRLTPERAAEILRDREVPGGVRAGMGNAAAINMLVATHSVIIDATEGVIWVSAGPHQLGAYLPFSLGAFDEPGGYPIIPGDPMLFDGSYERYVKSRALASRAEKLARNGRNPEAKALLWKAESYNPDFYLPYMLLGRIAFTEHDWPRSKELLIGAERRYPPYVSERSSIRDMLSQMGGETESSHP